MHFELTDAFVVAADLDRCWDFFGSAENLPLITPPWLRFQIAMPQPLPQIKQDTLLDYTIRWLGVPIRWRTKIVDWSPPGQFIDVQLRGPYPLWHHQHSFALADGGGVECRDRVVYKLPVPGIRALVHPLIVRRQLLNIFAYRRKIIAQHLGWREALQPAPEIIRR